MTKKAPEETAAVRAYRLVGTEMQKSLIKFSKEQQRRGAPPDDSLETHDRGAAEGCGLRPVVASPSPGRVRIVSWADNAIKELLAGNTVQIRPKGNSMRGRIESGQLVTIVPCALGDIEIGDVVLAKVKGRIYLHLVAGTALAKKRRMFLIKNNHGRTNGWTGIVYGKVVKVE